MNNNNDTIRNLIEELRQLRLQEQVVLDNLDRILTNNDNVAARPVTRLQNHPPEPPHPLDTGFNIGDRIAITNKITKPVNRPANRGDRVGVITKIENRRISIRTNNGNNTWRAPNNIRKLRHDE
jgi:hypothetical protein